eukprot:1138961-Pelagomonas_calceolata.AAC.12
MQSHKSSQLEPSALLAGTKNKLLAHSGPWYRNKGQKGLCGYAAMVRHMCTAVGGGCHGPPA